MTKQLEAIEWLKIDFAEKKKTIQPRIDSKKIFFASLNCSLCKAPFISTSKGERSPRKLFCGTGAICLSCLQKEEKLHWKQREHQCGKTGGCTQNVAAYFIIDLLTSNSLTLNENKTDYILSKPFPIPECPICHEEYSLDEKKREPYDLLCNHTICNECLPKGIQMMDRTWRIEVECPICRDKQRYKKTTRENQLKAFLRELPPMTKQLMKKSKISENSYQPEENFDCKECDRQISDINDMFLCSDCEKKICGSCAFRTHRAHQVSEIILYEVNKMVASTQEYLDQQLSTYKNLFPTLHHDVMSKISEIEKEFQERAEKMKKLKFELVKEEHEACRSLGDEFEQISEEYIPHLRLFDAKLKSLLPKINGCE